MSKLSPAPKPRHKAQKKRFAARRDHAYMAWLHTKPCLLFGVPRHVCWLGSVEGAHVKSRGAGGDDRANLVPLCLTAHREQHSIGTRSFERKWRINLRYAAERLYAAYLADVGRA